MSEGQEAIRGRDVWTARRAAHLTQEALALRVALPRKVLAGIEREEVRMSQRDLGWLLRSISGEAGGSAPAPLVDVALPAAPAAPVLPPVVPLDVDLLPALVEPRSDEQHSQSYFAEARAVRRETLAALAGAEARGEMTAEMAAEVRGFLLARRDVTWWNYRAGLGLGVFVEAWQQQGAAC